MENQLKPKAGPKDVFMHLLAIGTLYASAVSLIALLFQYVNRFLPDVLNPVYSSSSVMRNSIAVLIIVFPVYIFLTRFLPPLNPLPSREGKFFEIQKSKFLPLEGGG